jgi:ribosomal protein S18 acetylase RimI-like enzyme
MSSPPERISRRALTRADAGVVAALLDDDEVFFGLSPRLEAQDVLDWWMRADLAHDSWLFEEDARAVAVGWLEDQGEIVLASGCVHPVAKGRGIGPHVVDVSEARAAEKGARTIRQVSPAADAAACALFEGRGYRDVRHYFEMAIDLVEEPPAPELPGGLSIETFRTEDARAWHATSAEAFAEEWGFQPMPFDDWWRMRTGAEDFDPALWFLVRDGDEIAALARCDARRRGGGHVGMLAVRKPWRRRGLGLALLRHAFREFRRRGATKASLGVDTQNPTGAVRLYERAGMHVEMEYVTFERAL